MPRHLIQTVSPDISEQVRERLRRLLMHFDETGVLSAAPGAWLPTIDLCEMPEAIVLRVEIPGVAREDIRVSIRNSLVKIEGRKNRVSVDENESEKPLRYLCLERAYGRFERTIALQWPVEVQQATARLDDGVLEIRLPKTPAAGREVQIAITTS